MGRAGTRTELGALGLLGGPLGDLTTPMRRGSRPAALGVMEYRVLGTNFRDYAIVFTQLELEDEAFSTVELYSECPRGARRPCSTCRGYKGIRRLQPPLPPPSESVASLWASPLYEVASWDPHAFLSWLHPHRPAPAESRALHKGRDTAPDARAGGGGGPHGAKGLGIRGGQSPCQPSLQSCCRQASQPQGYQGHPLPPRSDGAGQSGGPEPLRQVEPGPGLPVTAAGQAADRL